MTKLKLLVVEDNEEELDTLRDTADRVTAEKGKPKGELLDIVSCKSVDEALKKLDNSFDGALIDLKLDDQDDGGIQVIKRIEELCFRVPVIVLTGTPDPVNQKANHSIIDVLKKGESNAGYDNLLRRCLSIYNTGLTRIMGGRGCIEVSLGKVFYRNILPQIKKWESYGVKNDSRTEKALLRYVLNHVLEFSDDEGQKSFPEEVYLSPPLTDQLRTGSIIRRKNDDAWDDCSVVMNPACDLVPRGAEKTCKTDRILLVTIENQCNVSEHVLKGIQKEDKRKDKLLKLYCNNHTTYYHWLPKTDFFSGGFLNFRNIFTVNKKEFCKTYQTPPEIQISPSFVKDIVARFSSYYARQGQPDIDCEDFIEPLLSQQSIK